MADVDRHGCDGVEADDGGGQGAAAAPPPTPGSSSTLVQPIERFFLTNLFSLKM